MQSTSIQTKKIVKGGKFVAKALLATLMAGGILATGALVPNLFRAIEGILRLRDIEWLDDAPRRSRTILNTFSYLVQKGYVQKTYRGKQLYISLTKKGRKKAGRWSIDALQITSKSVWDKKWRMVLFDIEEKRKAVREALRGKLKELGFYQLQKSVWIHAFPCEDELRVIQTFFELDDDRFMCFEVLGISGTRESDAKAHFGII